MRPSTVSLASMTSVKTLCVCSNNVRHDSICFVVAAIAVLFYASPVAATGFTVHGSATNVAVDCTACHDCLCLAGIAHAGL